MSIILDCICPQCGCGDFGSDFELEEHLASLEQDETRFVTCTECGCEFEVIADIDITISNAE